MIANDQELAATQARIATFESIQAELRVHARPEEFTAVSSGSRLELETMQREIVEYLSRHASEAASVASD